MDKKLVCATGMLTTSEIVQDPTFGLEMNDTIKIERKVEVYQWIERTEEYNSGDETKTRKVYEKGWSSTK